jgi:hypothetical protein
MQRNSQMEIDVSQKYVCLLIVENVSDFLSLQMWGKEIKENPPVVEYSDVMASDQGVGRWTDKIVRLNSTFRKQCSTDEASRSNTAFATLTIVLSPLKKLRNCSRGFLSSAKPIMVYQPHG